MKHFLLCALFLSCNATIWTSLGTKRTKFSPIHHTKTLAQANESLAKTLKNVIEFQQTTIAQIQNASKETQGELAQTISALQSKLGTTQDTYGRIIHDLESQTRRAIEAHNGTLHQLSTSNKALAELQTACNKQEHKIEIQEAALELAREVLKTNDEKNAFELESLQATINEQATEMRTQQQVLNDAQKKLKATEQECDRLEREKRRSLNRSMVTYPLLVVSTAFLSLSILEICKQHGSVVKWQLPALKKPW